MVREYGCARSSLNVQEGHIGGVHGFLEKILTGDEDQRVMKATDASVCGVRISEAHRLQQNCHLDE